MLTIYRLFMYDNYTPGSSKILYRQIKNIDMLIMREIQYFLAHKLLFTDFRAQLCRTATPEISSATHAKCTTNKHSAGSSSNDQVSQQRNAQASRKHTQSSRQSQLPSETSNVQPRKTMRMTTSYPFTRIMTRYLHLPHIHMLYLLLPFPLPRQWKRRGCRVISTTTCQSSVTFLKTYFRQRRRN